MADYEQYLIKTYDEWAVYLHQSQYYLGRVYIWSHRPDCLDLCDTTADERQSLWMVMDRVKSALTGAFIPDHFNWAALGNVTTHCHMHVIPRYRTAREFNGALFRDERWGKNYAPYDTNFTVPEETLIAIRDELRERL